MPVVLDGRWIEQACGTLNYLMIAFRCMTPSKSSASLALGHEPAASYGQIQPNNDFAIEI